MDRLSTNHVEWARYVTIMAALYRVSPRSFYFDSHEDVLRLLRNARNALRS